MNVQDIMTRNPACSLLETPLQQVAGLMVEHDCGAIPLVDSRKRPVGIVTDRDIVCRSVMPGRNPLDVAARDVMTAPCVTVTPETTLEDCCKVLEDNKIRRVLVVDASGACCGIVAQADIARCAPPTEIAEVVKEVSIPAS